MGGARTETVALDQLVHIEIFGDAPDEIHVHTYDLIDAVSPEAPAMFDFTADIPGVHEIELHSSGRVILELRVVP